MTVLVVGGPDAPEALRRVREALVAPAGPVALVAAGLVIPDAALAPITEDPFAGTALLFALVAVLACWLLSLSGGARATWARA